MPSALKDVVPPFSVVLVIILYSSFCKEGRVVIQKRQLPPTEFIIH